MSSLRDLPDSVWQSVRESVQKAVFKSFTACEACEREITEEQESPRKGICSDCWDELGRYYEAQDQEDRCPRRE